MVCQYSCMILRLESLTCLLSHQVRLMPSAQANISGLYLKYISWKCCPCLSWLFSFVSVLWVSHFSFNYVSQQVLARPTSSSEASNVLESITRTFTLFPWGSLTNMSSQPDTHHLWTWTQNLFLFWSRCLWFLQPVYSPRSYRSFSTVYPCCCILCSVFPAATVLSQMILPNLPNAKIEDVSRLFRNHVAANKLPTLGVMVSLTLHKCYQLAFFFTTFFSLSFALSLFFLFLFF